MAVHVRDGALPAAVQGGIVVCALPGVGCIEVEEGLGQRRQGFRRAAAVGGALGSFGGRQSVLLSLRLGIGIGDKRHGVESGPRNDGRWEGQRVLSRGGTVLPELGGDRHLATSPQ